MTVLRRQHTIPTDGLVGEWLLDGNGLDSSGNNLNGTPTNVSYIDSTVGYQKKVGSFDGSSSGVNIANNALTNNMGTFSISVWIKLNSYMANQMPFSKNWKWFNIKNTGVIEGDIAMSGTTAHSTTTNTVPLGEWSHIIFEFSSNLLKIYLNGVECSYSQQTTGTGSPTDDSSKNWLIGRYEAVTTYTVNGLIRGVRLYNKVLSQEEKYLINIENSRLLGFSQGNVPPDTAPQFQWKLDGNSTASIGGNNGTDTSISYIDSDIGKMANFPALGSKIVVTETTSMALTNFTLSAFFSVTNTSNFQALISRRNAFYQGYMVYVSGGNINFLVGDGTDNFISIAISANTRYHIVATYDNTAKQMKLYLNAGTPVSKTNTNGIVNSGQLNFGYDPPNGATYGLIGTLDHINIDTSVASVSRITQLYFEGTKFSGKYLPEDFSEGLEFLYTGKNLTSTLYDQSGKSANATLTNVSAGSQNIKGLFPLAHGSTSNIDLTNAPNAYITNGNWTIGILFTPTVTNSGFLFACDNNSGVRQGCFGFGGDSKFYMEYTGSTILSGQGIVFEVGKTYLLIVTKEGNTVKSYVNGVQNTSHTMSNFPSSANIYTIGRRQYAGAEARFSGNILLSFGHSKTLSANQIKRIFTSLFS